MSVGESSLPAHPGPFHPNRRLSLVHFLTLQLKCTMGTLPANSQIIYLMLAGDTPYVGRTANVRKSTA